MAQPTIFKLIHENKSGSVHLHTVARELRTTPAYLTGLVDDQTGDLPLIPDFTSEERDLLDLFGGLAPKDRAAVMQLVRTIATSAQSAALNSRRLEYRAPGRAARP